MPPELPAHAQEMVEIASRSSECLVRLVDNLQQIEKIESGKIALDLQPVEVASLMEEVVGAYRSYTALSDVRFVLQQSVRGDARVLADRYGFTQVLVNLLSNAVNSSPSGGTVSMGLKRLRGRVRVVVSDQGSGIPEEIQPRVFDKFVQAQGLGSCQQEGSGLDLGVAKALVEKMGGRIGFNTKPDKGTTFFVDLPESYEANGIG